MANASVISTYTSELTFWLLNLPLHSLKLNYQRMISSTILQFIQFDFTKLQAKIFSILPVWSFFCSVSCSLSKEVDLKLICSVFSYYSPQLIFFESWTRKLILKRLSNASSIAPLASNSLSTWEYLKTFKNFASWTEEALKRFSTVCRLTALLEGDFK